MGTNPLSIMVGLLAAGLAATGMLTVSAGAIPGLAARDATPAGVVVYDSGLPPGDEGRALFANIFVGEILEETRRGGIPTSDPEIVIPLVYYNVRVDRVLEGDLKGTVEISVDDVDGGEGVSEYEETRGLRVGERYLFFAGSLLPSGAYGVTPGLGTIAIEDAKQEEDLVARFERLIPQAERADARAQAAARDVVELLPDRPAAASVEPQSGTIGTEILVVGENFAPGQVLISWDVEGDGTEVIVGDDFAIRQRIAVPEKARPGEHVITITDGYSPPVEIAFRVDD